MMGVTEYVPEMANTDSMEFKSVADAVESQVGKQWILQVSDKLSLYSY